MLTMGNNDVPCDPATKENERRETALNDESKK